MLSSHSVTRATRATRATRTYNRISWHVLCDTARTAPHRAAPLCDTILLRDSVSLSHRTAPHCRRQSCDALTRAAPRRSTRDRAPESLSCHKHPATQLRRAANFSTSLSTLLYPILIRLIRVTNRFIGLSCEYAIHLIYSCARSMFMQCSCSTTKYVAKCLKA